MPRIIPTPKTVEMREGTVCLSSQSPVIYSGADNRIHLCLKGLLSEAAEYENEGSIPLINITHKNEGEGYHLLLEADTVTVEGEGSAGAFYALQTLRQLIRLYKGEIPCMEIWDSPDFPMRGFYLDISRGRVPTLEKLCEIADTLSRFKINSLQLYVEDAFTFEELSGIANEENALTPEEIRAFDAYCSERFIDLVPSMSTFGHLYTLLQSDRYKYICELPDHIPSRNYWLERQWHHTVDPYNPDTIKVIGSMIDQFLPLFSSRYFNICCDETIDLCRGVNEGKDKGEAYFYHVEKLCQIAKSYSKRIMMWGDECMARPDMAKERLPEDIIVLNWCYRREVAEWIPAMFAERGFSQISCTGTSCWDNFMENIFISKGNIESYSAHAKKHGSLGILNTNWGDFGHICPFSSNLYGLGLGAEKSWNTEGELDLDFEVSQSILLYSIEEFNMASLLRKMARAMASANWSSFVIHHSAVTLEGKKKPISFGGRPDKGFTAEDARESLRICEECLEMLYSLGRDDGIVKDLSLSVRGVALMNRLVLYLNSGEEGENKALLQADFDSWFCEYSKAWLSDNKPSQLWRLSDFFANITDTPKNCSLQ